MPVASASPTGAATPTPTASSTPSIAPSAKATATPTPAATATPTSAAKLPIVGLVAMGSLAFNNQPPMVPDNGLEEIYAHPNVYAAADINLTWAQLEPQQGMFDDSALKSALSNVAAYNKMYPAHPVAAKLRIYAGGNVPAWVIQLTGGPITISNSKGSTQIAAFWSGAYDSAWQALQAHLASQFDKGSAIAEVAVSSCSSLTAEPFIVALDEPSLGNMQAVGFSDATYQACLQNAPNDYAVWSATPLDYTFNLFNDTDRGSRGPDPAFTVSVMQAWRSSLGGRAIEANHGLQPTLDAGALPIYDELQTLGPPIEFQSVSPTVDWNATIALGMTYHPTEIEIWPTIAAGGQADISQSQLETWASEFSPPAASARR